MLRKKLIISCLALALFLSALPAFSAGETIALHPLKGGPYAIVNMCFDVLYKSLLKVPGSYVIYVITEDDWPPDIPPGGFPAILCPRPSITRGASYVFTGEVAEDTEYYGSYRLRLYLWNMKTERIVYMDELTTPDRATCEIIMPMLLENMMSFIGKEQPASAAVVQQPARPTGSGSSASSWDPSRWMYVGPKGPGQKTNPVDNPDQWVYMGPEREKWLYLGLRGGAGSSQWMYDMSLAPGLTNNVTDYWSANAAFQLSFHLARFFDIQTEANASADFGPYGDASSGTVKNGGVFVNYSMTVPLLLKLSLRGSHLKVDLFGGAYLYFPLGQTNGAALGSYGEYKPDWPGLTFGVSAGWKTGPGYFFLDGRFEYDGLWYNKGRDVVYYRNTFKMNAGYEIGIITKK